MLSLIKSFKKKADDIKTIHSLCTKAEEYALNQGEEKPGAEHFLLSALDLPDGRAEKILQKFGYTKQDYYKAIVKQYHKDLESLGIEKDKLDALWDMEEPLPKKNKIFHAQPSGQLLFKRLYELNNNREIPLNSLDVLEVVSGMDRGIAVRALKSLGLNFKKLKEAITTKKNDE